MKQFFGVCLVVVLCLVVFLGCNDNQKSDVIKTSPVKSVAKEKKQEASVTSPVKQPISQSVRAKSSEKKSERSFWGEDFGYDKDKYPLRIEYGYDGNLGSYGIADTANAYLRGGKVASAKAIRIIEMDPGPNALEVKETQYSSAGSVIYRGEIIFRFGGLRGAYPIQKTPSYGNRKYNVFQSWPSGR